jgi:hypothetical protein
VNFLWFAKGAKPALLRQSGIAHRSTSKCTVIMSGDMQAATHCRPSPFPEAAIQRRSSVAAAPK